MPNFRWRPGPEAAEGVEPIAIVGMGCRWPGDCESPSQLWDFLLSKRDGYGTFPADRINASAFYHPDVGRPGSFYTEGGCFLKSDVRNIDHTFFGIHSREAASLDPAQRKFLEVVYEALESAGVSLDRIAGSSTGTFVGNFNYDHQLMQYRDAEYAQPYAVTGGGITVLSNRVNYVFDLKGPSMTLDTACSSSMYALHWACEAIHAGECTAAIVGGSNLILTPECQIFSSALGAVSPTSRCHTFDVEADGYARADGIGALYIKKLSEAIKDGDPIRAVIRATAVNANGRTGGITHPSPDGQEAVMRRAYERAGGLDPANTTYFECHGTGTAVGDPIETEAVGRVFASRHTSEDPLYIGSIKTNLGHSEASSGIAGVMKAVLALENGIIPPIIGLKTLNPNVNLWDDRLSIVTDTMEWPSHVSIRRASINSFGYGGANAHTILESVETIVPGYVSAKQLAINNAANPSPRTTRSPRTDYNAQSHKNGSTPNHSKRLNHLRIKSDGSNSYDPGSSDKRLDLSSQSTNGISRLYDDLSVASERSTYLLPFSAHDQRTLRKNVEVLAELDISIALKDIIYTLSERRSRLPHRSFLVSSGDIDDDHMEMLTEGTRKASPTPPKIGFVFTGQGAQWPQMGITLLDEFPVFYQSMRSLDEHIQSVDPERQWTLLGVLKEEPGRSIVGEAEIAQPTVTAIQICIVDLLRSWKLEAHAVVGHSSGEIAASYAAGLISQHDAIVAAYLRGKSVARNEREGRMLAVGLSAADVSSYVEPHGSSVVVACHNSPSSCTLSGDKDTITVIKQALDEKAIFARELQTGGNAYHSPHMRALGEWYQQSMDDTFNASSNGKPARRNLSTNFANKCLFFSSVEGKLLSNNCQIGPQYWRANMESPVLFAEAATAMLQHGDINVMVEIGPHSALKGPLRQVLQGTDNAGKIEYVNVMERKSENVRHILSAAGTLFALGATIDILAVNGLQNGQHKVVVDLPHYAWQYDGTPILTENRWTREWRLRQHARHDLLGSRIPGGVKSDPTWRNVLRLQDVTWLSQHSIGNDVVVPSAGYIAMAYEAAIQISETSGILLSQVKSLEIQNMTMSRALLINEDTSVETLFNLRAAELNRDEHSKTRYDFYLVSVVDEAGKSDFVEHCRGSIELRLDNSLDMASHLISKFDQLADFHKMINTTQWYERFTQMGLAYGSAFQGLLRLWEVGSRSVAGAHVEAIPSSGLMEHESRYLIHPATLDAVLQLSMVAAHESKTHYMKKSYMPTKVESMIIRPNEHFSKDPKNVIAQGRHRGVRGLSSDLVLRGYSDLAFLEARNVFFLASNQQNEDNIIDHSPYTRMVWKPRFSELDDVKVALIFPPIKLSADAVFPLLNTLALYQLINFRINHESNFKQGSNEKHLNRLLQWTEEKLKALRSRSDSIARNVFSAAQKERDVEIARRSDYLNSRSSESRLMCHIYNNLGDIYAGKKSGIQVALQDNLLIDNYEHGQVYREGNRRLGKIIELLAHERPGLRILEIGAGTGSATREVLKSLDGKSWWRKYERYHFTDTTPSFLSKAEDNLKEYQGITYGTFDMEIDAESQGYTSEWDLVVASNVIHATSNIKQTLSNIRGVLKPGGKMILLELTQSQLCAGLVLGTFSDFWKGDQDPEFPRYDGPFLTKDMWRSVLPSAGFTGLDFYLDDYAEENVSTTVLCASAAEESQSENRGVRAQDKDHQEGVLILHRGTASSLVSSTAKQFSNQKHRVEIRQLDRYTESDSRFKRLVFLVETEQPFFSHPSPEEWNAFRSAITSARSAIWVSAGSLLTGKHPEFAMVSGLLRGLKTEMSHLHFSTLDYDRESLLDDEELPRLIFQYEQSAYNAKSGSDMELRRRAGITFISRLVQDSDLNQQSREHFDKSQNAEDVPLSQLDSVPIRLDIEKPGVLSTLYFREDQSLKTGINHDQVLIKVGAAGINTKDIAVVTGQHHSDSMSNECAGEVVEVGTDVTTLQRGDLVQCMSFARMGNFVRERAAFCTKIHPADSVQAAATLPLAFGTAIYGLIELGRLQSGESVLVQSATGGVGLAALQIAKYCGAEIFATVGSEEKKQELRRLHPDIPGDHILWSRERSTVTQLLTTTGGRGIDVILCSSRGQLMHDYWKCIAPSGRFIEIGRTEILSGGDLSLEVFRRNATFASFDLEVLSETKPIAISRLMSQIAELRSDGSIEPLPCQLHHISTIDHALASFGKAVHVGKQILTYEQDNTKPIKFRHGPFKATFDPQATYLLVGCLGGLGQSFSRWAVERGARSLLYLSRSGARKAEAVQFIDSLRKQGVHVEIALGDVAEYSHVESAVKSAKWPIKGVIQGALTLNDGLFESMTLDQFQATVRARVDGTLNLHKALLHQPLSFFQMWSSWTTMFGTATQSNYLASNAFMDAFARHRRSAGLPATSLSLSQVRGIGIVSYMPDYQQAMIRNGFYGNNEQEFLSFCEAGIEDSISLFPQDQSQFSYDTASSSQLLVGIEPSGLMKVDKKYPLQDMVWFQDPRFSLLLHATNLLKSSTAGKGPGIGEADSEDAAVDEQIREKIARLMYVASDEITLDKPISAYGIDSMVAAELRNWLFSRFQKEVSMLNLLSSSMTITKLAEAVSESSERN